MEQRTLWHFSSMFGSSLSASSVYQTFTKKWDQIYTHSLPIRNGVKSWWVRFLYFPDFWMVFVSYFPNFLWSPFLNFFVYFFQKAQVHLYNKKNLNILTHYNIAIFWFECIFKNYQPFGTFLDTYFSCKTICFLVGNKKIVSYFEKFNGLMFLMIEEFDGSFLIRAFLIERECV